MQTFEAMTLVHSIARSLNTLLIWIPQMIAHEAGRGPDPMPTHVAGEKPWQPLGRQVERASQAISSSLPLPPAASRPGRDPTRRRGDDSNETRSLAASSRFTHSRTSSCSTPIKETHVSTVASARPSPERSWSARGSERISPGTRCFPSRRGRHKSMPGSSSQLTLTYTPALLVVRLVLLILLVHLMVAGPTAAREWVV